MIPKKILAGLLVAAGMFSGCSRPLAQSAGSSEPRTPGSSKAEYHKISPEEAYRMMKEQKGIVILDVRSEAEYHQLRINGALLIPDNEIQARAEKELPDKNQVILVYCRSGVRSRNASNILVSKGYTNVYDIGGIMSWPYETVSS
jgi:rhodanese-related sulfurtransferase